MAQMKIRGNTQIIAGTITNTEINASAAIASSKLADGANWVKKDGSVAMTGALAMGTNKVTGLGTPTADTDAATKGYVDGLATGVDWKASVRVTTVGANITLSGTQTIDGVALSVGDRVLVKDQTLPATNGIYVVAAGAWTRATDADSSAEVTAGMTCWVNEGTANGDSQWLLTTNDAIVLGTTALTFTQISGLGQILAGAGLTKTGNTINVVAADNSITVGADSINVKISANVNGKLQVDADGVRVVDNPKFSYVRTPQIYFEDSGANKLLSGALGAGDWTLPDSFGTLVVDSNHNARHVAGETPGGLINGSNTAYTLANTPKAGSECVYLNGVRLKSGAGNDYTISGSAITMLYAPATGDVLLADYLK